MKRGTRKALERGLKMMNYLESNDDRRFMPDLRLERGDVTIKGFFKSHKEVSKFKRYFKIKRFDKSTFGDIMEYDMRESFVKASLYITLRIKGKLPPRCSIVKKEVWVDEHVEEGHYITRTEIVCDKPVETETEKEEV